MKPTKKQTPRTVSLPRDLTPAERTAVAGGPKIGNGGGGGIG